MSDNILGFLLINGYAFLIIFSTTLLFFSKPRLGKVEDTLYKNFLITNLSMSISGFLLGIFVTPSFYTNNIIPVILNKVYLICIFLWIFLLTFYVLFVSIKDNKTIRRCKNIFTCIMIIGLLIITLSPLTIEISDAGSALATGFGVMFTYLSFGIGLLTQIICVLINYKNIRNKKYTPVYVLIFLGALILLIQIVDPNTNYLINPSLIFVAVIMYHTIENPDIKLIEELQRSKEISTNSNVEKSMFLYNITQRIKNPVTNIYDNSNKIEDVNTLEDAKLYAREIRNDSISVYNTINDVLDISQVMSSKMDTKMNKYNANNLFKETAKILENNLVNENVKLNINISKDIPNMLYGDAIRLKQIINIVMNNAVKYTNEGLISYQVNDIIQKDICRLIITVEDTGIGMSLEKQEEINHRHGELTTEEIEELEASNNHLSIAKALASLIGGTLVIDSVLGKGTKITIVLDQKIVDSDSVLGKYVDNKKVLIVDNDLSEVKKLNKSLKDYDVLVTNSKGGESCLVKVRKGEKFDLILIKEEMDKLTGIDTFKKLKSLEGFNIPVVILTTNKDKNIYYNLGFSDVINIPIKPKEVDSIFDKYL